MCERPIMILMLTPGGAKNSKSDSESKLMKLMEVGTWSVWDSCCHNFKLAVHRDGHGQSWKHSNSAAITVSFTWGRQPDKVWIDRSRRGFDSLWSCSADGVHPSPVMDILTVLGTIQNDIKTGQDQTRAELCYLNTKETKICMMIMRTRKYNTICRCNHERNEDHEIA